MSDETELHRNIRELFKTHQALVNSAERIIKKKPTKIDKINSMIKSAVMKLTKLNKLK